RIRDRSGLRTAYEPVDAETGEQKQHCCGGDENDDASSSMRMGESGSLHARQVRPWPPRSVWACSEGTQLRASGQCCIIGAESGAGGAEFVSEPSRPLHGGKERLELLVVEFAGKFIDVVVGPPAGQFGPGVHERPH